ncbi:MAG: hypothetical protein WCG27_00860 [Pseudomonadota bacterium]
MKKVKYLFENRLPGPSMMKWFGDYFPFIVSLFVLVLEFYPLIVNPYFPGDSGTRLKNASMIVWNEGGGRYWLPLLQLMVHILYFFKIEFSLYKLIPLFFTILFLFCFNQIGLKFLKALKLKSIYLLIISLFFVTHPLIIYLTNNLYQEMPVIALFYFLLYQIYYQKNRVLLYVTWFFALLTREYFWIYFLVWGLSNWKKIVLNSSSLVGYMSLLLIPLGWIIYTNQSMLTGFNSSSVAITVSIIFERLTRLIVITRSLGLVPSVMALIIISISMLRDLKSKKYQLDLFEKQYLAVGLLSLLLIYLYIIFKDPWAVTPYNSRMLFPLIVLVPTFYLIYFKYVSSQTTILKYILQILLMLSLIINIRLPLMGPFKLKRDPFYGEISNTLSSVKGQYKNTKLQIGVTGIDYWDEYINILAGPLMYEKTEYLKNIEKIGNYQILITNEKNNYSGFVECKVIKVNKLVTFRVLCPRFRKSEHAVI